MLIDARGDRVVKSVPLPMAKPMDRDKLWKNPASRSNINRRSNLR